ncbi:hypothetical protein RND71_012171 [Anisodus tanguticus]|uniref:EF-hand domain-containing protein n=1 Tax=Anisodus tanguticus TaxID=243964 RepID=A0AAE1VPI6_9SOLA|nr:hypothetical protein RND71_012171 [Anisodus tanguticus]
MELVEVRANRPAHYDYKKKAVGTNYKLCRLFAETDRDANKIITLVELENLIIDMQSGKVKGKDHRKKVISEVVVAGVEAAVEERWAGVAKRSTQQQLFSTILRSNETAETEQLMAKILKHVENQTLEVEHILKDDGSPNIERMKEIFHQNDSNGNNFVTQPELAKLILSVKYGEVQLNTDDSVRKMMKDFDTDRNDMTDEHEFVQGMTRRLNEAIRVTNCKDKKRAIDEYDKNGYSSNLSNKS